MMEMCKNCGRSIGSLEIAHLHDGRVVCAECNRNLSAPLVETLTERDMLDRIPVARAVTSPLDELAQAGRSHAGKMAPSVHAPPYTGLQFAGLILGVFALLCYISALLAIVVAVVANAQRQTLLGDIGPFFLYCYGLTTGIIAGILHAVSASCGALRDIARNSFAK